MSTPDEMFLPEYDLFEAPLDATNDGAGVWLNGLPIVPSEFRISFDNFRATKRCRLVWRDGDFVGAAYET